MIRILLAIASLSLIAAGPFGDVYQPAYSLDHCLREPVACYEPQAGDLIFYTDDHSIFWPIGFAMAGTGAPFHSGIVVMMPDGTPSVLESGPDDSSLVEVCSLYERLRFHSCNRGRIWIRRRSVPLTAEQSCRLTEFAITQRHKEYAVWRMMGQATPMRCRGPLKIHFLGKPEGPKDSYFCSELILEAAVYAGLMDPCTTRPRSSYPRDYFFDSSPNPYLNKHLNLSCTWHPPARWVPNDCPACHEKQGTYKCPNPNAIPTHPYFLK
jgi:hypothetical protein